MMTMEIIPVPAFRDNYIWLLQQDGHAAVVDPGDASPVLATLRERNLKLDAILVTHHHSDHTGGVAELIERTGALAYAPRKEHYGFTHQPVAEGDDVELPDLQLRLQVLETPGHTLGHVVYYGANLLFCGDTLFSCGCGRLFEGSGAQLYHSLQRLAALPADTRVYCAHEYTQHNIRFALQVDAANPALAKYAATVEQLRTAGQPSLPSSIAQELATNPFLRCNTTSVRNSAVEHNHASGSDAIAIFCALRDMRNAF